MTHSTLGPAPAARRSPAGRSALVIGGGLAGTAAALELADAGLRVTLVEGRPRLGGLAFSFHRSSPAGELTVDNGQHVHLRCCTAYQWFLDRVGAARLAPLQGRLDIPVLDAQGRSGRRLGRLRRTALPVPLHLSKSLATYPHLSLAERAQVGRAALALGRLDPQDPALDGVDFAGWLRRHGQSPRAVEALWDLVGVATLNATAPNASLGLAAMVFKTGLLSRPDAADIGWARAPLGELHHTHAHRALDAAGVTTELRTRVTAVARTPEGRWSVAMAGRPEDEPPAEADVLILAVPQREAHALLPDGALKDPGKLLRIGTAPILNLHVIYDRTVLRRPFFAAIGSPVQWVFDRTDASGLRDAPGAGDSQIWRCRSPPRTTTSTARWPSCATAICPSWSGCFRSPAGQRCATSSSPGSAPPPSPPFPASAFCGRPPRPTRPASTWPVRGPPPAGPRPWRAPCAAVFPPPGRPSATSAARM
ncbi:hypothetical protein SANTM175S_00152 [Streptomyces antimycoticus]